MALKSARNLSTKVTVATILYLVLTALVLTSALYTLLDRLAQAQLSELGNALSAQLSETLKQPVINHDIISIQVILDNLLADTPVIARATVYSTANRIIAQSQRPVTGASLAPYIRPVGVDNNMLAQLRLELDQDILLSDYRFPMWIAVGIWFLLSAYLSYYLVRIARNYSRRLARLNAGLNAATETRAAEIDELESALSPFIDHEDTEQDSDDSQAGSPAGFAMLAISIPNLPKWQAQLNVERFTTMLRRVDDLLDSHLSLFKGERVHTSKTAMVVEFSDQSDIPPLTRAIDCANAFLYFANNLMTSENIPFDVRITAAFRQPSFSASHWFNNLEREQCVERLVDTLPLSGSWELIIDKQDLDESDQLNGCNLEDLSAASVWQFKGYRDRQQENFQKQLELLAANVN